MGCAADLSGGGYTITTVEGTERELKLRIVGHLHAEGPKARLTSVNRLKEGCLDTL